MAGASRRRWLGPLSALIALMLAGLACNVGTEQAGRVFFERVFRVDVGDQVTGDQLVLAYEVDLRAGSTVDGDLTLTARNAQVNGAINGDLLIVADRLELGPQAQISGDVTACVSTLRRAAEAQIGGELQKKCSNDNSVSVGQLVDSGWDAWRGSVFFRFSTVLGGGLLFGALAALGAIVFPRRLVRMSEALYRAPLVAGGVGLMTIAVAVGLTLLYGLSLRLLVTLALLPIVVLAWVLLMLLSLLGWMALAGPFGVWLFRRIGLDTYPAMVPAAIGGVILALLLRVWSIFWFTSGIGVAATILVGAVGLGAVILTRGGTSPYTHHRRAAAQR